MPEWTLAAFRRGTKQLCAGISARDEYFPSSDAQGIFHGGNDAFNRRSRTAAFRTPRATRALARSIFPLAFWSVRHSNMARIPQTNSHRHVERSAARADRRGFGGTLADLTPVAIALCPCKSASAVRFRSVHFSFERNVFEEQDRKQVPKLTYDVFASLAVGTQGRVQG